METEASVTDIRESLLEMQQKYHQATASNAQLRRDRLALTYQVETLKEELSDMEELLWESRRHCDCTSKALERQRQDHSLLLFHCEWLKEALQRTEELLTASEGKRQISDIVGIERDRLREEVVLLTGLLEKHGVVVTPEIFTNWDTRQGEDEDDVTSGGGDNVLGRVEDQRPEGGVVSTSDELEPLKDNGDTVEKLPGRKKGSGRGIRTPRTQGDLFQTRPDGKVQKHLKGNEPQAAAHMLELRSSLPPLAVGDPASGGITGPQRYFRLKSAGSSKQDVLGTQTDPTQPAADDIVRIDQPSITGASQSQETLKRHAAHLVAHKANDQEEDGDADKKGSCSNGGGLGHGSDGHIFNPTLVRPWRGHVLVQMSHNEDCGGNENQVLMLITDQTCLGSLSHQQAASEDLGSTTYDQPEKTRSTALPVLVAIQTLNDWRVLEKMLRGASESQGQAAEPCRKVSEGPATFSDLQEVLKNMAGSSSDQHGCSGLDPEHPPTSGDKHSTGTTSNLKFRPCRFNEGSELSPQEVPSDVDPSCFEEFVLVESDLVEPAKTRIDGAWVDSSGSPLVVKTNETRQIGRLGGSNIVPLEEIERHLKKHQIMTGFQSSKVGRLTEKAAEKIREFLLIGVQEGRIANPPQADQTPLWRSQGMKDLPAGDMDSCEEAGEKEATAEQLAGDQPAEDRPATRVLAAGQPATDQPAACQPAATIVDKHSDGLPNLRGGKVNNKTDCNIF
ncbi:uncharacterized protein [Antennarius striatus]